MQGRQPPLYALRTFVAAAHSGSFTRAAEELFITPAAVSRGIKSLESHLGVRLFTRMHRKVVLTAEGQRYAKELGDVFDRMSLATHNLMARQSHRPLRVCAYPSFVINWLIPRWGRHVNREFEVQFLTTMSHDVDFEHLEIDAAILSDSPEYQKCRCDLLFMAHLVPVCSPSFISENTTLECFEDLRKVERLHSETRPNDWKRWLHAVGTEEIGTNVGLWLESSNLMYEAAKAGMGVAIAIQEVVERDLASGSLIMPFSRESSAPCPYYLIYSEDHELPPTLVPFRNWLIAEYHR